MTALALFCAAAMAGKAVGRRGWGGNQPPTVNAGSDQSVSAGATVNLSASGNDPDGSIASYAWTQISGTSISFSNAAIANPTFTAPGGATVIGVRCTVTDNLGATAFDDVQITVTAAEGAATTMRAPFIHSATGGSGLISGIAWIEPDKLADGNPGTATSYSLYWGPWSEAVAGTVGPGGTGNSAGAPRTGITGSTTTNITGLDAGEYVLVPVSVNGQGPGAPGSGFRVTVVS